MIVSIANTWQEHAARLCVALVALPEFHEDMTAALNKRIEFPWI